MADQKSMRQENNMNLKPFDGEASCPKCGHEEVRVRYERAGEDDDEWESRPKYHKWPVHEFLMRVCERCDYQWPEAVITSPKSA